MQTPRKWKASSIRSLLVVAQPGARLLLVAGTPFVLNGAKHTSISRPAYNALIEQGWITAPRQIEGDLAECRVTAAGYATAATIEAQKHTYSQLELCFEQNKSSVA